MLKIGKEAKDSLVKGINTIADAVKTTMGAEGKTVIIRNKMGFAPHVTKDGITVAENIELEDSYEELGASLIKQAARKTVDMVGDGTTTSIVITQELIKQGILKLEEGFSHVDLREGMNIAVSQVKKEISKLKKKVTNQKMLEIASISANNDKVIGKIISDVYKRVGVEGTIEIIEGVNQETTVKYIEGLTLERGWALPHFVTDQNSMVATLENVSILIWNGKINSVAEIASTIRETQSKGSALVIFVDDIDEPVMKMLAQTNLQGTVKLLVCINPDFGVNRTNILEDLAAYTGGEVYEPKISSSIQLGFANKIIADKNSTAVIVENASEKERVKERETSIIETLKTSIDKFEIGKLTKRLSNLKNSVAIISVGGNNPIEIKEKIDRIEDSKCAVKSAIEGGYVSGGGSTLYYISKFRLFHKLSGGQKEGFEIVKSAIQKPLEQILLNANLQKDTFYNYINNYGHGVNVKTKKVEDLLKTGVIDSAKVVEVSLDNANAIATLVLGTDCLISTGGL